jgi:adenosylcobinamide-GDP ribazoletransferase
MKRVWRDFVLVWSLITRIPLPKFLLPAKFSLPSADALVLLPLAGGLFGLVSAIPARALASVIPGTGAAWIASAIYTALGWSLHLDGWGDLCDGIGSCKRGEELRAVMKDTRIGAFGAAGIALAVGTRAALLSGVETNLWLAACAISCGAGRLGGNMAAYLGKYPWENGMARDIVRGFGNHQMAIALAVTCLALPLWPGACLLGIFLSCAGGALTAGWAMKNMGGVNGDVIGASAVLGEIMTLAGCAALGQ